MKAAEQERRISSTEPNPEGFVECVSRTSAYGWACYANDQQKMAEVLAVLDGAVLQRVPADKYRADLQEMGKREGNCAFEIIFPSALSWDELNRVELRIDKAGVIEGFAKAAAAARLRDGNGHVDGFVEAVTAWVCEGWALDRSNPLHAIKLQAFLNGDLIGTAQADRIRPDLAAAGIGIGMHGYRIQFDRTISDEQLDQVRIQTSDGVLLPSATYRDSPRVPLAPLALSADQKPASQHQTMTSPRPLDRIEGAVDHSSPIGSRGWVWMPSNPVEPLVVNALHNGVVVAKSPTGIDRPDLAAHGKGTGLYGFELVYPKPLYGEIVIVVRGQGLHDELETLSTGSEPTRVNSEPNPPAGSNDAEIAIDYMSRWKVSGWAWRPANPAEAVTVEVYSEGMLVGRREANIYREDLFAYGKGSGLYGYEIEFSSPILKEEETEVRAVVTAARAISLPPLPPVTDREAKARTRGTVDELLTAHSEFTSRGPLYEDFEPCSVASQTSVDLIAFYLPQFHAIAENDEYWGKGFTEWRQLARGISRFPGHVQPRIPRDLGFYSLTSIEALVRQSRMARRAGINCFAYYYYWFNRKRVLEKPLDAHILSDVDMPFMIIWANENWTRTWDGSTSEVLLAQDYNDTDEDALIADLARHFSDDRYYCIDSRPLFVIYNPKAVPDAATTIARWRRKLWDNYALDPLIFMTQTFGARNPKVFGIDGAMEFPPHKLTDKLEGRPVPDAYGADYAGRVIAYDDFVSTSLAEPNPSYDLIKTVVPNWDNESRRPNRGLVLEGSTPQKYEKWLGQILERAKLAPIRGKSVVAINAWNEWAEGAYLEPDVYFGSAYLNATSRALRDTTVAAPRPHISRPKITAILPNFNHERFLEERIKSVLMQSFPPDEVIFLDDESSDNSIQLAERLLKDSGVKFSILPNAKNSGNVFKQWIKGINEARNEWIWIAETDDSADYRFIEHLCPLLLEDGVCAAFGRIQFINEAGERSRDLAGYYDGLTTFSWHRSQVVTAYDAFRRDFAIVNVVPNASGLIFRRPVLTEAEISRLYQYRFAGDWYFYALLLRGGAIGFSRDAKSYFRVGSGSASRSKFSTPQHVKEHRMILHDLTGLFPIPDSVLEEHARRLEQHLPDDLKTALRATELSSSRSKAQPLRICVAAHSFAVGGGEVLPVELANSLKARGHHVTFLVIEDYVSSGAHGVRARLRSDIPVITWASIQHDFAGFCSSYGLDVFNSHNVSVEYQIYCKHQGAEVAYVSSLHGGYETVPEIMTPDFRSFLERRVDLWLYLSDRNLGHLSTEARSSEKVIRSFNAVPTVSGPNVTRRELNTAHSIDPNALLCVVCSRAIAEKGWETAILAVEELTSRGASVHLLLAGEGPEAARLAERFGTSATISFLGYVASPAKLLPACDVALFPSVFSGETFPLFLLECFQAGLPVVASDIGEIPYMMTRCKEGMPGILVSHKLGQREMAGEIASGLERLFSSPLSGETMRIRAEETSVFFGMDRLVDLYVQAFTQLGNDWMSKDWVDANG